MGRQEENLYDIAGMLDRCNLDGYLYLTALICIFGLIAFRYREAVTRTVVSGLTNLKNKDVRPSGYVAMTLFLFVVTTIGAFFFTLALGTGLSAAINGGVFVGLLIFIASSFIMTALLFAIAGFCGMLIISVGV